MPEKDKCTNPHYEEPGVRRRMLIIHSSQVMARFDKAAEILNLEKGVYEYLQKPVKQDSSYSYPDG